MLISLREARETYYWFEVIEASSLLSQKEVITLKDEANQIIALLVSITKKLNKEK